MLCLFQWAFKGTSLSSTDLHVETFITNEVFSIVKYCGNNAVQKYNIPNTFEAVVKQ